MVKLNPNQIGVLLAHEHWGPGGSQIQVEKFLDDAIAICLSESGGRTDAKNPNSSASGLWQVMVSVHRDKIGSQDIFDPVVNTRVAHRIYDDAGGWTPWEVYNNGSYKKNKGHGKDVYAYLKLLTETELGEELAKTTGKIVPGGGLVTAATKISPTNIAELIMKSGKVVGLFVMAVVLVILGIWFIISSTKTGKVAKGVATKVVTKGVV